MSWEKARRDDLNEMSWVAEKLKKKTKFAWSDKGFSRSEDLLVAGRGYFVTGRRWIVAGHGRG